MSSIRLLVVSQHFYPEIFRINEVVTGLLNRGVSIDVFTGLPNYPHGKIYPGYEKSSLKAEKWNGVTIYRVPIFLRGNASTLSLLVNYISFILSAVFFSPFLLYKNKYNIIFCYATSPFIQVVPAIFLSWIKGARLIVNVQDLWPESISATGHIKNKLILRAIDYLVNWIYKKSDLLLVQSRSFETLIRAKYSSAPILYWPNSVESIFLEGSNVDIKIDYDFSKKFTVLFAGNIGRAQSIETIVSAAEILKWNENIDILFVGDGSNKDFLLGSIKEKKLSNIYWLGSYPLEAMPSLFAKASVLLASLSNQEIFSLTIPNKIQAYLAAGKPIIACMNGEGARIIELAGAGYAVPANASNALASTILHMSQMSSDELSKMGERGRVYFYQNFENNFLLNRLINIFENQIKES